MSVPALVLSGFKARIDEESVLRRKPQLKVDGGVLRLTAEGVTGLLPPDLPATVERVDRGRLLVRTHFTSVGGTVEIVPTVTPLRHLRLEITSFRATGLLGLPVPISLVLTAIRGFVPPTPGVYFGAGGHLELDLPELVKKIGPPEAPILLLPPLRDLTWGEGTVSLIF